MAYESEPTRLAARSSRSILVAVALVVIGFGTVMAGLASVHAPTDGSPPASQAGDTHQPGNAQAVVSPSPLVTASPAAWPLAPVGLRASIRCHAVADPRCTAVAQAAANALRALGDPALPPPVTIEVWRTILCASTFDCPPQRLTGRQPAGSVVVGFGAAAADVWINVTDSDGPHAGPLSGSLEAWVIASGPS